MKCINDFFLIKAGESQSLACKHHRSNPFVVPVASKECAGCVVFFWFCLFLQDFGPSEPLTKQDHLSANHHNDLLPPQWRTNKFTRKSKETAERTVMVECRYSASPPPKEKECFFLDTSKSKWRNSYILLWMIPHPQKKPPPKIPGDVIGKERRLNDRIARNSQWFTSLQSRSTEVRKTQNTWQH